MSFEATVAVDGRFSENSLVVRRVARSDKRQSRQASDLSSRPVKFWASASQHHCYLHRHSKLDYCNSIYYDLPACQLNRLQLILNSLARAVVRAPKSPV